VAVRAAEAESACSVGSGHPKAFAYKSETCWREAEAAVEPRGLAVAVDTNHRLSRPDGDDAGRAVWGSVPLEERPSTAPLPHLLTPAVSSESHRVRLLRLAQPPQLAQGVDGSSSRARSPRYRRRLR
jgi:hypothetical protein